MAEILSGVGSALRPAAKQVIKGGLLVTNALSECVTGAEEEFKGLLQEARTEVNNRHAARSSGVKAHSEGLYECMVHAAHAVRATASEMVQIANAGFVAIVAWFAGESKEKAEKQVDKFEEHVEHLAKHLTEEEGVNVIETLLLAAV
jgi:hypothetical protein